MSATRLSNRSVSEKLALLGGAASLALASTNSVDAGIVAAQGTPFGAARSGETTWDVDGNGSTDFQAYGFFSTSFTNGQTYSGGYANFGGYPGSGTGGRFVRSSGSGNYGFPKLSIGKLVGPSMTGGLFFESSANLISATSNRYMASQPANGGWTFDNAGFFGFKFTAGANTYYGWGEMVFHSNSIGQSFTITRAYYDDSGAAITVGDTGSAVPEPSTCALALLAAGGVAAFRSRRKATAV